MSPTSLVSHVVGFFLGLIPLLVLSVSLDIKWETRVWSSRRYLINSDEQFAYHIMFDLTAFALVVCAMEQWFCGMWGV